MRGKTSKKSAAEIESKIPQIDNKCVFETFSYNFVFSDIDNNSDKHVSLICLGDAVRRWQHARIAILECHSHIIWYRKESKNAPEESLAVLFGKFYADYVSQFLYAIGEDLAEFSIRFLADRSGFESWLKNERKKIHAIEDEKKREKAERNLGSSLFKRVRKYLIKKHSQKDITKILDSLCLNNVWKKTLHYRNVWVHSQPPIIEKGSIHFRRKSLIWRNENAVGVNIGRGSMADFSIDELVDLVQEATTICKDTIIEFVDIVAKERNKTSPSVW